MVRSSLSMLAFLLLLPLLLPACAELPEPAAVARAGSAGIALLESLGPSWPEGAEFLDLAMSGTGPGQEFEGVVDALRLSDGTVVVGDQGSRWARFLSPQGRFITATGRDGEGPGEYRRIRSLSLVGVDSVVVFDYWLRRVTLLSSRGELGRVISLAGVTDRSNYLWANASAASLLAGRRLAVRAERLREAVEDDPGGTVPRV